MAKTSTDLTSQSYSDNIEKVLYDISDNSTSNVSYLNAEFALKLEKISGASEVFYINNITNIEIKRDYLGACGDEVSISFIYGLGDFIYDILPDKDNFIGILSLYNLDGNGNLYKTTNRYKVVLTIGQNETLNPEVLNVPKEKLNQSKAIEFNACLIPIDFLLLQCKNLDMTDLKVTVPTYTHDIYKILLANYLANTNIKYKGQIVGSKDYQYFLNIYNIEDYFYDYFKDLEIKFKDKPDLIQAERKRLLRHYQYDPESSTDKSILQEIAEWIAEFFDLPVKKLSATPLGALNRKGFIRTDNSEVYPVDAGLYLQNYYVPKEEYGGEYLTYDNNGRSVEKDESHTKQRTIFLYPLFQTTSHLNAEKNKVNNATNEGESNNEYPYYLKCFIPNNTHTYSQTDKTYWLNKKDNYLSIIAGSNTEMIDMTNAENLHKTDVFNVIRTDEMLNEGGDLDLNGEEVLLEQKEGYLINPDGTLADISEANVERVKTNATNKLKTGEEDENWKNPVDLSWDNWSFDKIQEYIGNEVEHYVKSAAKSVINFLTPTSSNETRSSLKIEKDALSKNLIFFEIEWKFGNPDLIYPGMPIVIYKYDKRNEISQLPGFAFLEFHGRVTRTYTSYSVTRKSIITKIHCLAKKMTF